MCRVVFDPEDVIESTDADIFRIEDMTFSDVSNCYYVFCLHLVCFLFYI